MVKALPLLLPLFSALLILGFGRYIGKIGSIVFSVCNLALSSFLSCLLLLMSLQTGKTFFFILGTWFDFLGPLQVKWEFQFDSVTLVMITMVTFISMLVHIYSWSYMEFDPFLIRFIGLLSLFTFFMLVLLSSANFVQLFLGWEGIGICSYFLIGFWYTRIQANKSALKAMVVNRVGDIALLLGLGCCVYVFNSLDFSTIFLLAPLFADVTLVVWSYNLNVIELICFFLLLAAVGKSAQIGLHTWLPDAMEGPTPVSALIHAATMVTAGIFLVVRCSFLFEYAPESLLIITLLGALTALLAATSGLVQTDIKKVIAYSTCSQLGYMFYACGLSNYIGSIFHLINHAFFKALLFLSAGSVIHAFNNEQDMRKMGAAQPYNPITYISLLIGSLALIGFPFLDGFYSKDFILEFGLLTNKVYAVYFFSFVLVTLTAIITFVYSLRLLYLVFWSPSNSFRHIFSSMHESHWILLFPLIILVFGSLFFGYITKDWFIGSGSNLWNNSIYYFAKNISILDVENLLNFKLIILLIIFGSVLFSIVLISFFLQHYSYLIYQSNMFNFLVYKWYFDFVWNKIFIGSFNASYTLWLVLDKGILEFIQPISISHLLYKVNVSFYWSKNNYLVFYGYTSIVCFFTLYISFMVLVF
jgi:proton-translocating NADH-quinone oxidoreductase chain L